VERPEIILHQGDLPADMSFGDSVAVDTESMGLLPLRDRLCLVQLSTGDGKAHLVQFKPGQYDAPNLKKMLTDSTITKLFHFARADLAMIFQYLNVMPSPVYCTKVASVLARTFTDKHSLKDLTHDLLGLDLEKELQTSDWGAAVLSEAQKLYAASDVLYLHKIRAKLDDVLVREGRESIARAAFGFLPARALLDIAGWNGVDIFAHKPARGV
jgi:ribonuclease D